MTPQSGRMLRLVAYLIEAVSMIGLVLASRQPIEPRRFAGLDQRQWSFGLALGLSLWVVSTIIIFWPRKRPGPDEQP